jgi:hypothetical protein
VKGRTKKGEALMLWLLWLVAIIAAAIALYWRWLLAYCYLMLPIRPRPSRRDEICAVVGCSVSFLVALISPILGQGTPDGWITGTIMATIGAFWCWFTSTDLNWGGGIHKGPGEIGALDFSGVPRYTRIDHPQPFRLNRCTYFFPSNRLGLSTTPPF